MKKILCNFFFGLYLFPLVLTGQTTSNDTPVIILGDSQGGPTGEFADKVTAKLIFDAGGYSTVAFTNLGSGSGYYLLTPSKLGLFDSSSNKYLGSWPLITPDPCTGKTDCISPWHAGRWSSEEAIEPLVATRRQNDDLNEGFTLPTVDNSQKLGCLSVNPLKYGDIDSDGKNELVILFKNDLVVFSPVAKKVIFATLINNDDWIEREKLADDGAHFGVMDDKTEQYNSLKLWVQTSSTGSAYRGYAKIYTDDFDSDKASDIILWRKFYKSKLKKDPIKGFEKVSDTYIHYKKINGEYKKQPTDSTTVKKWLADKQLTWQKGYPSKSECKGQEGILIPEMHDPLLNDADVLN